MIAFAEHLDQLTASSREIISNEAKSLDEWISHKADTVFERLEQGSVDASWDSVVDVLCASRTTQTIDPVSVKTVSNSKLGSDHVLALVQMLTSSRTNDEISTEVVELVGLDNIELGMELVQSRTSASQQLIGYLHSEGSGSAYYPPKQSPGNDSTILSPEKARLRIEETLKTNASRPLFTGISRVTSDVLPHVYTSSTNSGGGGMLSQFGTKYSLPVGTSRHDYEARL
ncbi:hypothetical protein J3A83DRAFT_4370173 [Scleroderma citrinum]